MKREREDDGSGSGSGSGLSWGRRKQPRVLEKDRISDLPDSILCHILSFVNTITAVQTCVLSKRWRNVWTSITSLNFRSAKSMLMNEKPHTNSGTFKTFIIRVLALRDNSKINTFCFKTYFQMEPEIVDQCISYALSHGVEVLKIRSYIKDKLETEPKFSMNCDSLRVLKLVSANPSSMLLPKSVCLPGLTTLILKNIIFGYKNSKTNIFSGCPSLENLILRKCMIRPRDKLKIVVISALQLKHLEILNWRCPWTYFKEKTVSVCVPKLTSFKCEGHLPPLRFEEGLSCVDTLSLDLCYPTACRTVDFNERKRETAKYLIGTLEQFVTVRSLTLSLRTIKMLSAAPNILLRGGSFVFDNLTSLKIKEVDKCMEMTMAINILTSLLKTSAKSETLVVDLSLVSSNTPYLQQDKRFEFGRLKHLKLKYGRRGMSMMLPVNALSYLLRISPSAETLIVGFSPEVHKDL